MLIDRSSGFRFIVKLFLPYNQHKEHTSHYACVNCNHINVKKVTCPLPDIFVIQCKIVSFYDVCVILIFKMNVKKG